MTGLIPSADEVLELLRQTGALRSGHFECLRGLHADQYLDLALAMREYRHAKTLCVGLGHVIRANPEIRAAIPDLSLVAACAAGLPIAYGVCESLNARQVYWAEKKSPDEPLRFRQYLTPELGEQVLLVDEVLRAGVLLAEARELVEVAGGQVAGIVVVVHQPAPSIFALHDVPVYCLARLEAAYFAPAASCELCKRGVPLCRVGKLPPVEEVSLATASVA